MVQLCLIVRSSFFELSKVLPRKPKNVVPRTTTYFRVALRKSYKAPHKMIELGTIPEIRSLGACYPSSRTLPLAF